MINDFIRPTDFGAKGDGITDDTISLNKALNAACLSGKTLYIQAGTYLLNNTIGLSLSKLSKDIGIFCDPATIILASKKFPIGKKFINIQAANAPKTTKISFKWCGGTIDARDMPPGGIDGKAPDALTIGGNDGYIAKVDISNLKIITNDTINTKAADSCLMITADDINISNCIFQGAVDCGIYLSGSSSSDSIPHGERCRISGNSFINCKNGFISKRSYQYHIIDGNFFTNCINGCVIGGQANISFLPGKKGIISNNILKNVNRGIELRNSDYSIITGNRIEDYGINDTTPTNESAIKISGSNYCLVTNNITGFSNDYIPNPGASAIFITTFDFNNIIYPAKYNFITNNLFTSPPNIISTAIKEVIQLNITPDYIDFNTILNNSIIGFKQNYILLGKNSQIQFN